MTKNSKKIRTGVKAGGWDQNHNTRIRTGVKAGGYANHNAARKKEIALHVDRLRKATEQLLVKIRASTVSR